MRSRLRGLFQVDNAVPASIVAVALLVSLEPRVFGLEFSDRQIVLALFALLGVNAIMERSGHLHRMGDRIEHIVRAVTGEISRGHRHQGRLPDRSALLD